MTTTALTLIPVQMAANDGRKPTSDAQPDQTSRRLPGLSGMGAAWMMIGAVVIGIGLGLWLDRHFNSMPWATLSCSMVFMAAGIYLVIREGSR